MNEDKELLEAVAVTAELTGTDFTPAAAKIFAEDLKAYPHDQVIKSLRRCRQECKGRLSLADVISRLEDGRPGADEAWAMIPIDERASCVWTDEMAAAYGVVASLMDEDRIAARMAFKETYNRLVATARGEGRPPKWTPSLGWDAGGRQPVLEDAVRKGRLTLGHVAKLLPPGASVSALLLETMPEEMRSQLKQLIGRV